MRKKEKGKVIDEGSLPPTDEVYDLGLVVGGKPLSAVRPKKASSGKERKGRGSRKGKGG
jgi:hypothetical protein